MNFNKFVNEVIKRAKAQKIGYLVPNNDTLFSLWQQKLTTEQVITLHCTKEAQRKRHGLPEITAVPNKGNL
jgi:hypothetical protein